METKFGILSTNRNGSGVTSKNLSYASKQSVEPGSKLSTRERLVDVLNKLREMPDIVDDGELERDDEEE